MEAVRADRVTLYNALNGAASYGHANVVGLLLSVPGMHAIADYRYMILTASSRGYADVVNLLLGYGLEEKCSAADLNDGLVGASQFGHTDVVKLLLNVKTIDPAANDNAALRAAFQRGHGNVVRLLLAVESVRTLFAKDNYKEAHANMGNRSKKWEYAAVKFLLGLKDFDPAESHGYTLKMALRYGYRDVVELLKSA
ncbi:hypothetical protein HDU76_008417, partial [Blyttiomyces sp. JEL0837]